MEVIIFYIFTIFAVICFAIIIHGIIGGNIYLKGNWYNKISQPKEYYGTIIIYIFFIIMMELMRNIELV